ncbi:MAG: peptide deformylase, partial [Deltaproteobacteria bacterium]
MLLEILKYPDPRLAEKSTPVEVVDDEIRTLI